MKNIFGLKKGFTLIELLVVITIVGILTLGLSKINFDKNVDRDHLNNFANNIYTNIEKIRNNSLLGKGIGENLLTPARYKISISTSNSGSFDTYYSTGIDSDYIKLSSLELKEFEQISNLSCYDLGGGNKGDVDNLDLIYKGAILTLSGCSEDSNRIAEIKIKYKSGEKKVTVNSVSGLIKIESL